jgi:type I restriction enzyme S subunit
MVDELYSVYILAICCQSNITNFKADRAKYNMNWLFASWQINSPSFLAKAFRGELVPQDPNDKPAEKLLERIRTKKDATPVNRQTKRKNGK